MQLMLDTQNLSMTQYHWNPWMQVAYAQDDICLFDTAICLMMFFSGWPCMYLVQHDMKDFLETYTQVCSWFFQYFFITFIHFSRTASIIFKYPCILAHLNVMFSNVHNLTSLSHAQHPNHITLYIWEGKGGWFCLITIHKTDDGLTPKIIDDLGWNSPKIPSSRKSFTPPKISVSSLFSLNINQKDLPLTSQKSNLLSGHMKTFKSQKILKLVQVNLPTRHRIWYILNYK